MNSKKLSSVLPYQFTTQNGDQNLEASKFDALGFFSPSIPNISASARKSGRHPWGVISFYFVSFRYQKIMKQL